MDEIKKTEFSNDLTSQKVSFLKTKPFFISLLLGLTTFSIPILFVLFSSPPIIDSYSWSRAIAPVEQIIFMLIILAIMSTIMTFLCYQIITTNRAFFRGLLILVILIIPICLLLFLLQISGKINLYGESRIIFDGKQIY